MMAITRWTKLILAVVGLAAVIRAQETYTVGVIEQAPLVIRAGNGSDSPPTGFIPDVLDEIANSLDVTFRYVWTDTYGSKNPDDTWSGLVGMVMNGEVDIGGAALTITSRRERVLDFSKPYMTSGIAATMAKPEGKSRGPDYFLLFRPFRVAVWVLFVVCFVVFSLCLFLLNKYHPFEHKAAFAEGNSTEKEARGLDLGGSFWLTCTLTLLQGFDRSPRSKAGRVLFVVWGLFVLVTIVLYATTLVQIYQQGHASSQTSYRSVQDIVDAGVDVGYLQGGSTADFFETSTVELYETVASRAQRVADVEEGLEKARQGGFAFFTESALMKHDVQNGACELVLIGQRLNALGFGFAFQEGNAMRDTFNEAILSLQEDGVLHDLEQAYWQDDCPTDQVEETGGVPAGSSPRPLSAAEYTGVIVFFLVGLLIAALVATVEVMLPRLTERTPKNTNEKLISAEEGQALNQTAMSALDETTMEPTETAEAEPKKGEGMSDELEPEDKEEQEGAEEKKKEEDDPDRIEHISSPVEVKS